MEKIPCCDMHQCSVCSLTSGSALFCVYSADMIKTADCKLEVLSSKLTKVDAKPEDSPKNVN